MKDRTNPQAEPENPVVPQASTSPKPAATEEKMQESLRQLQQARRELQNAQAELAQMAPLASLGRLLTAIAHEISTPLGVINSNNDVLVRALPALKNLVDHVPSCPEKPRIMELFDTISANAEVDRLACQRVSDLVRDVRTFARPDPAERKPYDVREGLNTTLALVRSQFKNRVRVEKDYAELPRILARPNQINQVFLNLLVNAGQAIEGPGTVRISTRQEHEKVVIRVADTGKGIPPENLKRLFQPGFTTKEEGSGLGLSISSQIVRGHGGTIEVESEVGKGTVFTITLPVQ